MIHQERVFLFPDDMGDSANAVFHYDDGEDDGIPLVQAKLSNGLNQFIILEFTTMEELESFMNVMGDFFQTAGMALESTLDPDIES